MTTRPRVFLPIYTKGLLSWLPLYFVSKDSIINELLPKICEGQNILIITLFLWLIMVIVSTWPIMNKHPSLASNSLASYYSHCHQGMQLHCSMPCQHICHRETSHP